MNKHRIAAAALLTWQTMIGHFAFADDVTGTAKETPALPPMTDGQIIELSMKKQFDKPEAPLFVAPISIEGDHAVAGWIQDQRGGRALLGKVHGVWQINVCSGDALKEAAVLVQAGLSPQAASRLAQKIREAESRLPADQLKKMSLFEGTMNVGGASHGHAGDD